MRTVDSLLIELCLGYSTLRSLCVGYLCEVYTQPRLDNSLDEHSLKLWCAIPAEFSTHASKLFLQNNPASFLFTEVNIEDAFLGLKRQITANAQ